MRQVSLMGLVSLLALFLGGCPADNEGQQAGQSTPSPSPVARRLTPPSPPNFPSPLAPQQPGNPTAVAGLIQSLPAEARLKQIAKGRSDPFAVIPVQPEVTVEPTNQGAGGTGAQPVPPLPRIPVPVRQPARQPVRTTGGDTGGGTARNRPGTRSVRPPVATTGRRTTPKRIAALPRPSRPKAKPPSSSPNRLPARPTPPLGLPPVATAPGLIPQLPPLPEPTQARGIEVSGVVEVGGVPRAIVKVPNEPSRTVREGDRLFNGQVLVKRIEVNQGPTPLVVLEQYGIEVAKRVGEGGQPGQPGAPTAFLPAPIPGNTTVTPQA